MSQEGGSSNTSNANVVEVESANATPESSTQMGTVKPPCKKRKAMKVRSEVWAHFEKIRIEGGVEKARCNYCNKEYECDSKNIGTTTLKYHMSHCKEHPKLKNNQSQTELDFQPSEGGMGALSTWKFDQECVREGLSYMIIVDELPFNFVENGGFKLFMSRAQPRFRIPSRWTVSRDCYQLYISERTKLKNYLRKSNQRVCLTTDTWTSPQRISYMCLTIHYIDDDWTLNKRIINFYPIDSHKGLAIGKLIERCLLNWGIENVLSITVDNASSNDVAVDYLKDKLSVLKNCILSCKYLHMRCVAHIVNLVVVDGLKEANISILRIRSAVRYVRQSPARLARFKECIEVERIASKKLLCLDVSTRWNSTYLMLDTAQRFEKAFDRYRDMDSNFEIDLKYKDEEIKGLGIPTIED